MKKLDETLIYKYNKLRKKVNMKIGIAADHHGVEAKSKLIELLKKRKHEVKDYGTNSTEAVDYPLLAFQLGEDIAKKEIDFGILLCGSGIGMSIACNKVKGVRCAKVNSLKDAYFSRYHNNANVIALSAGGLQRRLEKIVDLFLVTSFSKEERHHRRVRQIDHYKEKK